MKIPHLIPASGWPSQTVIDLNYAKLGASLTPPDKLKEGGFAFFGLPFEGLNINEIGGKAGPTGMRKALSRLRPYSIDLDINFLETNGFSDLGDIEVEHMDYDITFARTEAVYAEAMRRKWIPMVSGGSHSITEPCLRAFSDHHKKNIGVVWFDGHPDLMDNYKGDKHYCGCPLRRNLESGHVKPENVVHIGMRGFANSAPDILEWREKGVTFITMEEFHTTPFEDIVEKSIEIATRGTDAFYVTFDIDAMDETFAPATQYNGPGGLYSYDAMRFVRRLGMAGAGAMDIAEYAPLVDLTGQTGNICATLFAEFMAGKAWNMRQAS